MEVMLARVILDMHQIYMAFAWTSTSVLNKTFVPFTLNVLTRKVRLLLDSCSVQ